MSQFKFAKDKLEALNKEALANYTEEELAELTINFIYLGKVYSDKIVQKFGNKKNNEKQQECN